MNKIEEIKNQLQDCSGCTYDKDEGTHQAFSKQHFEEFYIKPLILEAQLDTIEKLKMAEWKPRKYEDSEAKAFIWWLEDFISKLQSEAGQGNKLW